MPDRTGPQAENTGHRFRGHLCPALAHEAGTLSEEDSTAAMAGYLLASTTCHQMLGHQVPGHGSLCGRCEEPDFTLLLCTHSLGQPMPLG